MSNLTDKPSSGDRVQVPDAAAPAAAEKQVLFPIRRSWTVATVVAVVMVLLALLGVGLTTTNPTFAYTYWLSLAPIYGLLCVGTACLRASQGRQLDRSLITRQVFHWLGVTIAVGFDFYIFRTKMETGDAAGMNAMLILALGCFLAGVHFEWLFILVSVLLVVTLVIVATAEQYMWLIFVVGGLTIALMFVLRKFFKPAGA